MTTRNRKFKSDSGAVSLQGIIVLIVVVIIAYVAIAFFPLFSVPNDLTNEVKVAVDEWLKLSPKEQNPTLKKQTAENIKKIVDTMLADHIYDKKKLEIKFSGTRTLTVTLPYTINIDFFGTTFTYDKKLEVDKTTISF